MTLRFGFVADDFTGGTDALWQFQRHGWRGRLFPSVESLRSADLSELDVVGVATMARASASHRIPDLVLPAVTELLRLGVRVVQYKVCSTFDSSPHVGSIGAVLDAVLRMGEFRLPVPILAAQPEFGRYTAFGTHFAAYDGEVHRLDRHLPMRGHPVTPATDADLRHSLRAQTPEPVGSVYTPVLSDGALRSRYRSLGDAGLRAVVFDAMTDCDIRRIGEVLAEPSAAPLFAIGSGGLSEAIAASSSSVTRRTASVPSPADGPVLVVAGSLSPATHIQISEGARRGWAVIDVGNGTAAELVDTALAALGRGTDTIVFSDPDRAVPENGPDEISARLAAVLAAGLAEGGVRRGVVAGGDTSGMVVQSLGLSSLEVISLIEVGAPLCRIVTADSRFDGTELVLKGGQVGGPEFFAVAAGRD